MRKNCEAADPGPVHAEFYQDAVLRNLWTVVGGTGQNEMRWWSGCGELRLEMDNLIMKRERSKEPQMRRSYNISSWRSSDIPSCSLSQTYRYSLYEILDSSLCAPSRSLPHQQAARRGPQR